MSEGIKEVSMTPEQKERNLQMFARYIHFWWPRTSDKEIQGAFERLGSRAAFRAERVGRRWAVEAGGDQAPKVAGVRWVAPKPIAQVIPKVMPLKGLPGSVPMA